MSGDEVNPNANRELWYGTYPDKWTLSPQDRAAKEKVAHDPDLNPVIHKRSFLLERYQGVNLGDFKDLVAWPEDLPKGKNFLVNETYVRVDGIDWFMIKSNVGKYMPIEITSGVKFHSMIQTPVCEGYVFAPNARHYVQHAGAQHLMYRCMRGEEIEAAKKDAVFLKNSFTHNAFPEKAIWAEYRHSTNDFGETDANLKLQAFNRALHKKRVAENLKRHNEGKKYDYEKLMNSTYDPKKHTLKIDPEFLKDTNFSMYG